MDDFGGLSFIVSEWTGNIAPALNFSQLSRLVNGNSFLFSLMVNLEVGFCPQDLKHKGVVCEME